MMEFILVKLQVYSVPLQPWYKEISSQILFGIYSENQLMLDLIVKAWKFQYI